MGSSLSAVSASPASFTPPSQLRRQLAQQQQQQQVQQRATENRIEMNEHVEAKVYKVNDTCSLCLETFTPADNVVHLIKCHNHFFHKVSGCHRVRVCVCAATTRVRWCPERAGIYVRLIVLMN